MTQFTVAQEYWIAATFVVVLLVCLFDLFWRKRA